MDAILRTLADQAGIHFMGADAQLLAQDAQPSLVTVSNGGIPAFLSTYVDPKVIDVLVSPMKAAEVAGEEAKKGDWTTTTAMFPIVESTGEVSSYGDYSNNGVAGANVNFPQRQSYHYQVITQWGEKELETMGLARIDWANRQNIASILTLNKFQNKSYFFGVEGLQNYGLLNDPSLLPSITPIAEGGNVTWDLKDALGVLADLAALFSTLQEQSNGLIDLESPMTLAMSPRAQAIGLTKTNNFNVNVFDLLKKNYPNLKIVTAPEYATDSGELVQLRVDELEGQKTSIVAFTEKLRAHPIVVGLSNFSQKKSQGTWGAINYRSFLIASMIGVLAPAA